MLRSLVGSEMCIRDSRNDNNGGNTASGALIGVNAGGVDNILIHGYDDLSAVSGQTVSGAVVTIGIATGFSAGNHGSAADDTITLNEIAIGNLGWIEGSGVIGGTDIPATDGSVSFLHAAEFNDATSVDWVDSAGNPVADLRGALTPLGTVPGYDVGGGTPALTFAIDAITAQSWVDNGLGGLALTAVSGDGNGRFNFLTRDNAANAAAGVSNIVFTVVPEPSAGLLLALGTLFAFASRRRR